MEIKASANYLRISPRKLRLLTSGWQGVSTEEVLENLSAYPRKGKEILQKLLKQAIANAENNFRVSKDRLTIKKIEIGEGPSFKRIDKSHGARFDRGLIRKRSAHVFLTLQVEEVPLARVSPKEKIKKANKVINKKVTSKNGAKS